MGLINNLTQSTVRDRARRLRAVETGTPMNSGAVGAGGFEVYDGGVITISNGGGLKVTGSIDVIGELIASGIITLTGELTQEGESTFTGPTHFEGDTDVTGKFDVDGPMTTTDTLSVEGVTTLRNDLNVTTGGKIKAGSMTMDPSVSSGALVFSNGAQVFTDATTIQVYKGTSALQVADGTATLQGDGSNFVRADGSGVRANGPLRATSTVRVDVMNSAPAGKTANVYWDPVDKVLKVTP